jgi:hypothetical protein
MSTGSARSPKRCIFCGSGGPLTREHVLRDKFNSTFATTRSSRTLVNTSLEETTERTFTELPYGSQVKAVCEECNRGWMNDLENEVEAVLISLMQGKATHLNLAARESLARWAGKTALMRQLQSAPSVVIKNNPAYQQVMTGSVPTWSWLFGTRVERTEDSPRTRSTLIAISHQENLSRVLITTLHLEHLMLVSLIPMNEGVGAIMNNQLANYEVDPFIPLFPSRRAIRWLDNKIASPSLIHEAAERCANVLMAPDPGYIPPELPRDQSQLE